MLMSYDLKRNCHRNETRYEQNDVVLDAPVRAIKLKQDVDLVAIRLLFL